MTTVNLSPSLLPPPFFFPTYKSQCVHHSFIIGPLVVSIYYLDSVVVGIQMKCCLEEHTQELNLSCSNFMLLFSLLPSLLCSFFSFCETLYFLLALKSLCSLVRSRICPVAVPLPLKYWDYRWKPYMPPSYFFFDSHLYGATKRYFIIVLINNFLMTSEHLFHVFSICIFLWKNTYLNILSLFNAFLVIFENFRHIYYILIRYTSHSSLKFCILHIHHTHNRTTPKFISV